MNRIVVPPRRYSEIFEFKHQGLKCQGQISWIRDGQAMIPIEIFLECGPVGSAVQAVARDTAVAASLGLQHGMTLETLRKAVTRTDEGQACGPLGAFLDLVAESANG